MENFISSNKKIKQMYYSMRDSGKNYLIAWCKGTNGMWETKIELRKSNITNEQQAENVCPNTIYMNIAGSEFTVPIKPNILKTNIQKNLSHQQQ